MRRARSARAAATPASWTRTTSDGGWRWLDFGLDPWEKDGAYYGACLAAIAVGIARVSYPREPDRQPNVGALKQYLTNHFADRPLHDRVLALWASSWLPGALPEAEREPLIEELLALQEPDGGWSLPKLGRKPPAAAAWSSHGVYPDGAVSDGYATGLVVLALERAGIAAGTPNLRRGIGWLVANERDGTWPANYLNTKRNPQDNVGMFMRDAATAFAVLALTSK